MHLNEISYPDARPIEGYGVGFFRIGGEVIQGGALITAKSARGWGGYDDTAPLLALAEQIDVLFVGTGAEIAHLPPDFRATLEATGLGVEGMGTPAACRTYNVLVSEGRRVAVALLPV